MEWRDKGNLPFYGIYSVETREGNEKLKEDMDKIKSKGMCV